MILPIISGFDEKILSTLAWSCLFNSIHLVYFFPIYIAIFKNILQLLSVYYKSFYNISFIDGSENGEVEKEKSKGSEERENAQDSGKEEGVSQGKNTSSPPRSMCFSVIVIND